MDFRQIEAFVYVIKLKSFSKAADEIYLTQPTVSAHISSLEKELNIKLIDRSGKDIVPTKSGRIFYDYAVNLLNIRDNAVHKLNDYSHKISGRIEIHSSTVPSQYIVPELILGFTREHKNVTFSVNQMDSKQVIENILEKQVELGIVGSLSDNDKLSYKHLTDDELIIITPNNKKFNDIDHDTIPLNLIENEKFIFRESGSGTRQEFEKSLKKIGFNIKSIDVVALMSSTEAIKQAVSLGLGISIISSISAEDYLRFGQVKAFRLNEISMKRAFYLVHHKNRPLSPLSMAFMDFAVDYFK